MKPFTLHERLINDTFEITRLRLSMALLMNDSSFPWVILVPMSEGVRELHDLTAADRAILVEEIAAASRAIEKLCKPDKINIGALGNIVPQLHIHVIGRNKDDRAWPGPVWGSGAPEPYSKDALNCALASLKKAFQDELANF
ncbi:MAG: HIT family protein [Deltaproteobacteria bacterium]|nr:HIT family protein [Deltaproteobacteria bacterium]MBZ0220552.1 HIT family protein [Deltaproteobacteria bacterium]